MAKTTSKYKPKLKEGASHTKAALQNSKGCASNKLMAKDGVLDKYDMSDIYDGMAHDMQMLRDRGQCDFDNYDDIYERINIYFESCKKFKRVPTKTGLLLGLGTSGHQLDRFSAKFPTHPSTQLIEQAVDMVNNGLEQGMLTNKVDKIAGIFILKSRSGYKEAVSDQVIIHKGDMGEDKTTSQLQEDLFNDVIDVEFDEED